MCDQLTYCLFEVKNILSSPMLCFTPLIDGVVGICKMFPLSEGEHLIPKIEEDIHIIQFTSKTINGET